MTRLLFILLLAVGTSLGPLPVGAGEPFTAPDGTAYPDDVQAILTEAKAAYDAEDFPRAHALWLPLAETGNAEAQYRVGRLYDVGEGFARNGPEAVKWYTRASNQAHSSATHNLALMYRNGEIIEQDHFKAVELYRLNAARGIPESQAGLGIHLVAGKGVKRDFLQGFTWLFIAKDGGSTTASTAIEAFAPFVPASVLIKARDQAK